MNQKLMKEFQDKICKMCEDKNCKRKPSRMVKCGVLYLVSQK